MTYPLSPQEFIRRIHAADGQMVLAIAGGGSGAIGELLAVPGGSQTVLEAVVPYSAAALAEFLHAQPEHFCAAPTARMMAMAAFQWARRLQIASGAEFEVHPPIGIGCTASLVSDRPKRGPHRIHVALQTVDATSTHSLELLKGHRNRAEEETIAARMILNAVAEAFGIEDRLPLALLENERVESERTVAPSEWRDLLLDRIQCVCALPAAVSGSARAIFPGAFHPLHPGHLRMAEIAGQRLGVPVEFEISIENVDKPALDYTEMQTRAAQFGERQLPLWFTRAPTFDQKSAIFPNATFIVGADTIERIGHCRYYGDSAATAETAIQRIVARGCRFLVFGRAVGEEFQTLADLKLPDSLRRLCDEVPATEFRHDISSTKLRKQ
jgi:nicotinamide mononucleotide (NMN) deamidase PncC